MGVIIGKRNSTELSIEKHLISATGNIGKIFPMKNNILNLIIYVHLMAKSLKLNGASDRK